MNFNSVHLAGNLTRDVEIRYTPSGNAVATLNIAINSYYTTQGGEKKQNVCYVWVIVWGKTAENCNEYLTQGSKVFVDGELQYRSWEKDGQKRSSLNIRARRVIFLDHRPKGEEESEVEIDFGEN